MTRPLRRPSRGRASPAALAASLLLLATTTACAQGERSGGASAGSGDTAAAAAQADSLLPRAERNRVKGQPSATVTLIEVSDFQCPFCARFAAETYAKLDSAYIRTGKVRLVFINYPLPNHREAWAASEAAMCAGAQDAFWPMHDRLFATQREWSGQADAPQRFTRFAEELKLDMGAFRACTEGDRVAPLILTDVMQASNAGVQGTPFFLVNGRVPLSGAVPFEQLAGAIEAELRAPAPAPGAPNAAPGAAAPPPNGPVRQPAAPTP